MTTDLISAYVDERDFTGLFIEELGWSRPTGRPRRIDVPTDVGSVTVEEVATLKGVTVWASPTVPDGRTQREIDRHLRGESTERLTIFHDDTHQQWKWPQTHNSAGSGASRLVTHEHTVGRKNEALTQRLGMISFDIGDDPTVVEVNRRLRRAFDADKVTKKFYKQFSEEHRELCDLIEGIEVSDNIERTELRWYASLLLNRLMFIYFMQRKGFLDDDLDYLRNRLDRIQSLDEPGSFYEFYRHFLIPLFHEGLGSEGGLDELDDPTIRDLIGTIPYVNGGIFSVHPLEEANDIRIPDEAFNRLFDFFDRWQWHLDDRPTGNPDEVNPDVLGYIFEQFVNNREEVAKGSDAARTNEDKGAYYTKEDVTGYMTASTLLPVFLERLEATTQVNPWAHLQVAPDRYIWPSILHGVDQVLPAEIELEAQGFPRPSWDASRPPATLALPAESWWEVVDRRRQANDLRARLEAGEVADVNAAITDNLDLETLAVDAIDALDNPADVAAAWQVLSDLRIVDPTCGSGAFLFAALGLLHTLYGAVLDAAERHVLTRPTDDLVSLTQKAAEHASRDYFLLKHATLNNLYGVDIMPEAVEIARLRLFLKLIAQIDRRADIEPLPDLDFNIRPGNILVGAVNRPSVEQRIDVFNHTEIDSVMEIAAETASTYRVFTIAQETGTEEQVRKAKTAHEHATSTVRQTLDAWWHEADGRKVSLAAYLDSHRPFHWFIEFPEVFLEHGGFDIVIGNPPYVATTKITYEYNGFVTDKCSDIYAPCLERATQITRDDGRISMIVPMNLSWGSGFAAARKVMLDRFGSVWSSTYDQMPSRLFEGVGTRNTIVVAGPGDGGLHTTSFNKWVAEFRPHLLPTQRYIEHETTPEPWPKVGHQSLVELATRTRGGMSLLASRGTTKHRLGHKKTANYWISIFVDDPPCLDANRQPMPQTKVGDLFFDNEDDQLLALAVGASRVMFLWWVFVGDAFDVLGRDLRNFPLNPEQLVPEHRNHLIDVGRQLRDRLAEPGDHLLWTPYKNAWYGNFDLTRCRDILADADEVLLEHFRLDNAREEFEVEYHSYMKSGGERPGTLRGGLPDRNR